MIKKIAFFSLLLAPLLASAAPPTLRAMSQKPYNISMSPDDGIFVFYAAVTNGTMPECSGDHRWSVKTDKPGAKALIAMVLAARSADRTISVLGPGTCNSDGEGYTISYLYYN